MKILIAKTTTKHNAKEILDFKDVEPMDLTEVRIFLSESIHFAQVEAKLTTPDGLASALIVDLQRAGVILIQPETD